MSSINENTVSGNDQMRNSTVFSYFGPSNAAKRILIMGNSITRHGPLKEIGWERDWGMAASAPEKDFVHRLYRSLSDAGYDVQMRVRQASFWEMNLDKTDVLDTFAEEKDFGADIIVFRLGENVGERLKPLFKEELEKLISYLSREGTTVVYTTCFWRSSTVDDNIREKAQATGSPLVELGDLGDDPAMKAYGLFEHDGVAAHPGDLGMEKVAERIFEAVRQVV